MLISRRRGASQKRVITRRITSWHYVLRAVYKVVLSETLFTNCALLDTVAGILKSGYQVLVRDRLIEAVSRERIGAPGAYADLLIVDGDPLSHLSVLTGQGENLAAIMKDGQ